MERQLDYCRLCLAKKAGRVDIFTSENDDETFVDVLQDIFHIEVIIQDQKVDL